MNTDANRFAKHKPKSKTNTKERQEKVQMVTFFKKKKS